MRAAKSRAERSCQPTVSTMARTPPASGDGGEGAPLDDISECPACGGRLRIIAALTDPTSIRSYLEGVGLPAIPPPRAPPVPRFEFAA